MIYLLTKPQARSEDHKNSYGNPDQLGTPCRQPMNNPPEEHYGSHVLSTGCLTACGAVCGAQSRWRPSNTTKRNYHLGLAGEGIELLAIERLLISALGDPPDSVLAVA